MLEGIWSKGNTPQLLVEVQNSTVTLEISMSVSYKTVKQPTSTPSNTTLGHITKECTNISRVHVLNYVLTVIVHNSQNMETTYMPLIEE